MKRICMSAAAGFLFVVSVVVLMGQDAPHHSPPDWEYRTILYADWMDTKQEPEEEIASLQSKLNELGADGWELIKLDRVVVLKRSKTRG